jgi:type II secretory pathway component PulC
MVWVAVGVTAATAIYGGVQANKAGKAAAGQSRVAAMAAQSEGALNEEMAYLEADDIQAEAAREADNIKRQAMMVRGTIAVAQSGSGAVIGEGSAQAAMDQLDTLSSADALAALYSGVNKSVSQRAQGRFGMTAANERSKALGAQAGSQEAAGKAALVGSVLQAAGGLAGGYARANTPPPKK